jgi:hypothetical protein
MNRSWCSHEGHEPPYAASATLTEEETRNRRLLALAPPRGLLAPVLPNRWRVSIADTITRDPQLSTPMHWYKPDYHTLKAGGPAVRPASLVQAGRPDKDSSPEPAQLRT